MIFLKHFSVNEQTLKGVGKVYVQRNSKVSELVGTINAIMGWAHTTPIKLFEVRMNI
jgi:ubiquitin carboxyl-terminal hydrolase 7